MPLGNNRLPTPKRATHTRSDTPIRKRINIDREIRNAEHDTLDWAARAQRLGQFLVFRVDTPITIGIQGDWGSGKSSFINLIETSFGNLHTPVTNDRYNLAGELRHYTCTHCEAHHETANAYVLRFDSWTFAQSSYPANELFPIYVTQVIEHYLQATGRMKNDSTALLRRLRQVGSRVGRIVLGAAANVAGDATSEAVMKELAPVDEVVDVLASFKRDFQQLIDTLLTRTDKGYTDRLIIIVDDLDRITPLSAVELTEKIKVLLDVEGVVFILAADLSIIQDGLREKFGSKVAASDGKNYLDKIVKIQYNVPQMTALDLVELALGYGIFCEVFGINAQTTDHYSLLNHAAIRLLLVFPSIGGNIRNSKRVLNNFEFSAYLLRSDDQTDYDQKIGIPLLALTILYQYDHDVARRLYRLLLRQDRADRWFPPADSADPAVPSMPHALVPHVDFSQEEVELLGDFVRLLAQHEGYTVEDWLAAFTATAMGASGGIAPNTSPS